MEEDPIVVVVELGTSTEVVVISVADTVDVVDVVEVVEVVDAVVSAVVVAVVVAVVDSAGACAEHNDTIKSNKRKYCFICLSCC